MFPSLPGLQRQGYVPKTPLTLETVMTTHSLRKSSRYRFHNSVRNDRKYLIVALASALILTAVLSRLGFDFIHVLPK